MSEVAQATSMRQRVERLEAVLTHVEPGEYQLRHRFAPGVYMREMLIPANQIATGAVHKTKHLTIVVGHCYLTDENGAQEFCGYSSFESEPGTKRAIVTIQDTIVTTIHPTEETDLDKLCELLTESKPQELLGGSQNLQMLAQKHKELGA
jgi:hypothetical protein